MLLTSFQCAFPGCKKFGAENHHITYNPEVTKRLCTRHHEEITILNGHKGRAVRHGLSNRHRWWIWYQWLEGNLKVRRTKKAMQYIEQGRAQLRASRVDTTERAERELREHAELVAGSVPRTRKLANRRKKTKAAKSGSKRAVRQAKASRSTRAKKKSVRAVRKKKTEKRTRKAVRSSR
jgi:hypothetical protein